MPKNDRQTLAGDLDLLAGFPPSPDLRLSDVRFNQYAYPAPTAASRAEWEARSAWVRRRILTAAGLAPMPDRTPLNARIWGEFEHEGVRIAKAQFESRPGFLCTGNLYLPLRLDEPAPAVLCPHGHWQQGRVHHSDRGSVPARCLMLARLGFAVFAWDMIGYNDSRQVVHRWPQDLMRESALWGISPFGLQLWNSIRALDFVAGLSEVDATRIGCTGASGGASQTWNLAAVDDRIRAVAPVCMLSAHYQGGCQCEEGPLLRLGDLTTMDIVGSLAPRPTMLFSVTGDWTNMNPAFEVPAIRAIYRLFGAEDCVCNVHFDAGHNYNRDTRERVYPFFLKHLAGRARPPARIQEPPLAPPPRSKALIFPDPAEPTLETARETVRALASAEAERFAFLPQSRRALAAFRKNLAMPFADVVGAEEPADVAVRVRKEAVHYGGAEVRWRFISRRGAGDLVPAVWIVPAQPDLSAPPVLVVHGGGKSALFEEKGFSPLMRALLRAGRRALAIDVLGVGATAKALAEGDPRDTADPTFYAFNPSVLSLRVQDVLTALAALKQYENARRVLLCGVGEGARTAMLAMPLAKGLSAAAFDLSSVEEGPSGWEGLAFHPMVLKVGGLRTAIALASPMPMLLNHAPKPIAAWAKGIFGTDGKGDRLVLKTVKETAFGKEAAGLR